VKPGDDRSLSADFHAHSQPLSHPSARREAVMKQEHVLIGRITGPRVFSVASSAHAPASPSSAWDSAP